MLGEHWVHGGVQWVCRASSTEHRVCHITVSPFEASTVTFLFFRSGKLGLGIPTRISTVFALDTVILVIIKNNITPFIATQSARLVSLCICSQRMLRTHVACRQTRGRFRLKADSRCPTIPLMSGHERGGGGYSPSFTHVHSARLTHITQQYACHCVY